MDKMLKILISFLDFLNLLFNEILVLFNELEQLYALLQYILVILLLFE